MEFKSRLNVRTKLGIYIYTLLLCYCMELLQQPPFNYLFDYKLPVERCYENYNSLGTLMIIKKKQIKIIKPPRC